VVKTHLSNFIAHIFLAEKNVTF